MPEVVWRQVVLRFFNGKDRKKREAFREFDLEPRGTGGFANRLFNLEKPEGERQRKERSKAIAQIRGSQRSLALPRLKGGSKKL